MSLHAPHTNLDSTVHELNHRELDDEADAAILILSVVPLHCVVLGCVGDYWSRWCGSFSIEANLTVQEALSSEDAALKGFIVSLPIVGIRVRA